MTDKVFNLDPDNKLPVLTEWVTLTDAATFLGVSRQHAYNMAKTGKFNSLHRLGLSHVAVVRVSELQTIFNARNTKKELTPVS